MFDSPSADSDAIAKLRQEIETLKQEKADLEMVLEINTTHADVVEAQLQANQAKLRQQQQAISALAHCQAIYAGDSSTALREITTTVAHTLGVERCSVWLYNPEQTQLSCVDLYEKTLNQHRQGDVLEASSYPVYIQTLHQGDAIAASHAHTDPRTQEFVSSYLAPLGITAVLDTPIQLHGEMVGVMCVEQVGEPRAWTIEEENFVSTVAYLVSLTMEAGARQRREEEIQLLLSLSQSINAAPDFQSALEVALRKICEATGWNYGEAWVKSNDGTVLEYSPIWHCQYDDLDPRMFAAIARFHQDSEGITLRPGEGLAGRIWLHAKSEWIPDVSVVSSESFIRVEIAQECGFKAGFGVPIISIPQGSYTTNGTENQPSVLAVLMFLMLDSRQQDKRLVELVSAVAAQLGTVMQQKLISAELKALISAMTDIIMVCDRQGRCLKVIPTNPGLNLSANDNQLSRDIHQNLPESTAQLQLKYIRQALKERQTLSVEYSLTVNQQELWFSASVSPLSEKTVLWVARDITERKQAEEALRRTEEKYRSIFENAVEGIFQSSLDGRYLSANQALAQIYGYDSPEALIAGMQDISQQLYVQLGRRDEFVNQIHLFGEIIDFESEVYRKDGSIIWISENVRAVKDQQGKLLYYEGIVQDITERRRTEEELRYQRQQTERLLLNILPQPIVERLKGNPRTIADNFAEVTVLFADIVDFTKLAEEISATDLVSILNEIFSVFDHLAEEYGLEKIKTIGDAYMAVGGLPHPRADHAEAIAEMALAMQTAISQFIRPDGEPLRLRIGINTGPVVAGVIGMKKFIYDLWGDTVNVASRMESHGIAGGIQVTPDTYKHLKHKYILEKRGTISIKGKGKMLTYCLIDRKSNLCYQDS